MNRIEKRMEELQNNNEKAFVTYMTAGLPDMEGTKALIKAQAEAGIDIYGFACFDAPEFAIFRMICNDPDKAEIVLNRSGYMNRITQAIVVDMKDQVGGLDELLKVASDSNVSLDYIYTSFHRKDLRPVVILQTEDGAVTECILKNNGFNVFTSAEELEK